MTKFYTVACAALVLTSIAPLSLAEADNFLPSMRKKIMELGLGQKYDVHPERERALGKTPTRQIVTWETLKKPGEVAVVCDVPGKIVVFYYKPHSKSFSETVLKLTPATKEMPANMGVIAEAIQPESPETSTERVTVTMTADGYHKRGLVEAFNDNRRMRSGEIVYEKITLNLPDLTQSSTSTLLGEEGTYKNIAGQGSVPCYTEDAIKRVAKAYGPKKAAPVLDAPAPEKAAAATGLGGPIEVPENAEHSGAVGNQSVGSAAP